MNKLLCNIYKLNIAVQYLALVRRVVLGSILATEASYTCLTQSTALSTHYSAATVEETKRRNCLIQTDICLVETHLVDSAAVGKTRGRT